MMLVDLKIHNSERADEILNAIAAKNVKSTICVLNCVSAWQWKQN